MHYRTCPLCFTKIPRLLVLSRSNDINCPACHAELEVSRPSRVSGSIAGILAALGVLRLAQSTNSLMNWNLPMLAAILAFGVASALVLFLAADLVVRPGLVSTTFPHQKS